MKPIEIHDGIHYVDVQRIYFKGEAGLCAGECRGGALGNKGKDLGLRLEALGRGSFFRRAAAYVLNAVFWRRIANAVGSDDKAGANPAGSALISGMSPGTGRGKVGYRLLSSGAFLISRMVRGTGRRASDESIGARRSVFFEMAGNLFTAKERIERKSSRGWKKPDGWLTLGVLSVAGLWGAVIWRIGIGSWF